MIISLLFPVNAKSQTTKIEWHKDWEITDPANVAYPNYQYIEDTWARIQAATSAYQSAVQRATYGYYSCVAWAKKVTGVYGTWGNGGRYLSGNSDGEIGDVVIFTYIHVAVVIARVGANITITEANYHLDGQVDTRTLSVTDPTIRGFHHF